MASFYGFDDLAETPWDGTAERSSGGVFLVNSPDYRLWKGRDSSR